MLKRMLMPTALVVVASLLACHAGRDACHDFAYAFCYEDADDDVCQNTEGDGRGSCYLTHSDGLCNYGSIVAVNSIALDICYEEIADRSCDRFDDAGWDVPDSCKAAFIPGI